MENNILKILTCPTCDGFLERTDKKLFCRKCQREYLLFQNTIFFSEGKHQKEMSFGKIFSFLLRNLNPINYWPFSYFTQREFKKLYESYLKDKTTARKFAHDYLPEDYSEYRNDNIILDFGCSQGRITAIMNQLGYKVVGLDKLYYTWWANLKNSNFVVLDIDKKIPFRNTSFDIIFAFLILEYLQSDEIIIQELNKKLKEHGYLILQVPNKDNLRHLLTRRKLAPSHLREYSIKEISDLLKDNNFILEKIWTERFYSPIFTNTLNYIFEILLPHKILDFFSSITPPKYRGIINIIARKK